MKSLTANDSMTAFLSKAQELTEIRDAQGKILGFFAPVALEHADRYALGAAQFNPQEIQRRKDQNLPGKSTAEVLAHLSSLEKVG